MKKLFAAALAAVMTLTAPLALAEGAVKIGLIGPLTGAAAIYGNAVANGAQIAVDELNAKGGLQFELNAQDDEHDPEKSINAYNNLLGLGRTDGSGLRHHQPLHRCRRRRRMRIASLC